MNGENDKLIRDFMNAFEKKDVRVLEEFFHPNVVKVLVRGGAHLAKRSQLTTNNN